MYSDKMIKGKPKKGIKNNKNSSQPRPIIEKAYSGRVITHYGNQLEVEILDGPLAGSTERFHQKPNMTRLVTGDLISWKPNSSNTGVIISKPDRINVFGRFDSDGKFKPLASNLNCVLIVIAAAPKAYINLVDRYLVAIRKLELDALLLLNKVDLIDGNTHQSLQRMLQIYDDLGYPILKVSAKSGMGLDALERRLAGQTTVLVGQSGVGKSSLINRLGSYESATVGNLSQNKYKGTHTTTTTRLYHLKNFDLIDSPGVREFGLTKVSRQEVLSGFPEIQSLASHCKFRDCSHQSEPSCAIREGLSSGVVFQERYDSYQNIIGNLD